jgi:hypothetical protein
MRVHAVGDGEAEKGKACTDAGPSAAGRARPRERTRGAGRRESGPKLETEEKPFPFSFPIFQSHFPKDFEIHFEFDANHSIQNFKCSSMNAQSCFYPYI